jgi:hypothetical protein
MITLVLDNPDLLEDVLRSWQEAGAPGATVLVSTGMRRVTMPLGRDDVPLLPSLEDLTEMQAATHRTLFTVLPEERIDAIVAATERITGDLTLPHTGMIFVVPVTRVVGGQSYKP